jgi:hypothetical protein
MWVILLDHSPSMFEAFSGEPAEVLQGKIRRTAEVTRWDAAMEALVKEIESLDATEDLALFIFDAEASLLFEGKTGEVDRLKRALENVSAGNGTDIAAALEAADRYLQGSDKEFISVEVISDGQSDEERARVAAQALSRHVGMIEVILIDPTPEARSLARAIGIRGRTSLVVSDEELRQATTGVAKRYAEEATRVESALARFATEQQKTVETISANERLVVTAAYPGQPEPGLWSDFTVFLHVPQLEDEVRRRTSRKQSESRQILDASSRTIQAFKEAWLTLQPRGEGLVFNPPVAEVLWLEDLQEIAFRFQTTSPFGTNLLGSIDVYADHLLVGQVPFAMTSGTSPSATVPANPALASGRMFESIFASYAHRDRDVVERCAAGYRALGIHMFIDRTSLVSGEEWHPGLQRLINDADVFQLYWSDAARESPHVRDEWEYALGLRDQKGVLFLRPCYWREPLPEPPKALASLHFSFLGLADSSPAAIHSPKTEVGLTTSLHKSVEPTPDEIQWRAQSIQTTVAPLVMGETRKTLAHVREQVAYAVAFLEGMTGLRYYPVPTLIVDRFVVQQVRSMQATPDNPSDSLGRNDADKEHMLKAIGIWRRVLQAQTLEYHTRRVPPLKSYTNDESEESFDKHISSGISGIPESALDGIREMGEWGINRWTWDYLAEPWSEPEDVARDAVPAPSKKRVPLSFVVMHVLGLARALLGKADLTKTKPSIRMSVSFSVPTSSDPSEFDYRLAWDAVRELPGWSRLDADKKDVRLLGRSTVDWKYEVRGNIATFIEAFECAAKRLEARLPSLDLYDYTSASGPKKEQREAMGDAIGLVGILTELRNHLPQDAAEKLPSWGLKGNRFDDWLVEAFYPSWRRARDWLGQNGVVSMKQDLRFHAFLVEYLRLMENLFEYGSKVDRTFYWNASFPISEATWQYIQGETAELNLSAEVRETYWTSDVKEARLKGPFTDFIFLFKHGAERLLAAIEKIPSISAMPLPLAKKVIEASTYGIFAPADSAAVDSQLAKWAVRNHTMPQVTLPGSARVLLCAREFTGSSATSDDKAVDEFLKRAVLVHEHFHAVVETGLGPEGRPPAGPCDSASWAAATALNESLAAWMEWHDLRRLAQSKAANNAIAVVLSAVSAYIQSGPYPAWPYRGAERVEALYRKEGINAIRKIIKDLRQDPQRAQQMFDEMREDAPNMVAKE